RRRWPRRRGPARSAQSARQAVSSLRLSDAARPAERRRSGRESKADLPHLPGGTASSPDERDQTLQPRVLLPQLTQLADLTHPQLPVLLLPHVEARLAHAQLPADIGYRGSTLGLPQRVRDLLLGTP